jgi:hypothetical protein
MAKRKLRIVRELPMLGICEYCNMQFSGTESQLAKSDIQMQFNTHKCTLLDSSQNALRIVREATENK